MTPELPLPTSHQLPTLTILEGIATLTLRRPEKRNRLQPEDLRALISHCLQIDADPTVRVAVLTADTSGQPRPVFCAGYDIGGFEGNDQDTQLFEETVEALAALRPVLVGALNGSVYGGATDMALACDLRVGLSGTEFRMPAAALGLHYYPSGLRRYVANFGINAARRAFLTARPLPVQELLDLGVMTAVATADQFDTTVATLVDDVQRLAPLAAQATKQSLTEIALGRYDADRLRDRQTLTLHSEDFAEGRAAFAERRPAVFLGR